MSAQGFTAYLEEWWHFDYGDQFWGLATGPRGLLRGNRAPVREGFPSCASRAPVS